MVWHRRQTVPAIKPVKLLLIDSGRNPRYSERIPRDGRVHSCYPASTTRRLREPLPHFETERTVAESWSVLSQRASGNELAGKLWPITRLVAGEARAEMPSQNDAAERYDLPHHRSRNPPARRLDLQQMENRMARMPRLFTVASDSPQPKATNIRSSSCPPSKSGGEQGTLVESHVGRC